MPASIPVLWKIIAYAIKTGIAFVFSLQICEQLSIG